MTKLLRFLEGWEETPNEIRHRLTDPGQYDTCRRKDLTGGVSMIYCKKTGTDQWEAQALRFAKDTFTMDQAKAWVEKHKESFKAAESDADPVCAPDHDAEPFVVQEGVQLLPSADGNVWDVVVFSFGKSKRSPHYVYTKESATRSLDKFNGARVYANSSADDFGHKKDASHKVPKDAVGVLTESRVTDTDLRASLNILPSAEWLKKNLLHIESKKLPSPYELSIDASGTAYQGNYNGEKLPIVESFDRVSVDVVERGAAGGKILKMVASDNNNTSGGSKMKQKLLALFTLFYPTFLESKKVDIPTVDENALWTYLLEADKPQSRFQLPDGAEMKESTVDAILSGFKASAPSVDVSTNPDPLAVSNLPPQLKLAIEATNKELFSLKRAQCQTMLESELVASRLPKPWQEHIRGQYAGKIFKIEELHASIKGIRETHSLFVGSVVDNKGLDIQLGQEAVDKKILGLEGLFMLDPNRPHPEKDEKEVRASLKGVPPYKSFREAYVDLTGDKEITGRRMEPARFSESVYTTDWTNVMAATLNRRMVRDYGLLQLDTWRVFTDIVSISNFKQQERTRFGGYANLATVAQGAPYLPMTSPSDEKATYTPTKKGGTEDITREMVINDDVGAIVKIPQRMARAAGRTLHEFVYDFIRPGVNPVIYDTAVLYITAGPYPHVNLGGNALDATYLAAARARMRKQTEKSSSKVLGIRPRHVVVPPDIEATAYALVTPAYGNYNTVPTFMQSLGLNLIVVDYWTDANDWVLIADRADCVGLEVGFVNGQETPELFISDMPTVGSYFTNDKITYKIRHEYGGAIVDFRAFDGTIV